MSNDVGSWATVDHLVVDVARDVDEPSERGTVDPGHERKFSRPGIHL